MIFQTLVACTQQYGDWLITESRSNTDYGCKGIPNRNEAEKADEAGKAQTSGSESETFPRNTDKTETMRKKVGRTETDPEIEAETWKYTEDTQSGGLQVIKR